MLSNCLVTAGSNIVNAVAVDREKDRQYRYVYMGKEEKNTEQ